jgi:hypothetical protein
MVLDIAGRGVYEKRSRRMGLLKLPVPPGAPAETNVLDPDYGGIYRYTYVRPEFIIGTCMVEKRSSDDWSGISMQNRWHGAIFSNHIDSRVFPAVEGIPLWNGKTYNPHWSVQNKGTLITQKLPHKNNGDMRVYFASAHMAVSESGGWVFANVGNAYAAVRPAWGTYTWDDGNWIRFSDPYAPAIMEVAPASDYMEMFAFFTSSVQNQTIDVTNDVLTYNGLKGSGKFTFYTASNQLPEINDVPIDMTPDYTFQSPFMNQDWNSGVVTISKSGRTEVLDFNTMDPPVCGDQGYLPGDINMDCYVDILDLKIIVDKWLAAPTGHVHTAPYIDSAGTSALWHMDSVRSNKYVDDDDSVVTDRDANLILTPNPIDTGGPTLTDPGLTAGLDYPGGNSAFKNCIYFDGVNDGGAIGNASLALDPANVRIESWCKSDAAADGQIIFDRWGQTVFYVQSTKFTVLAWDGTNTPGWYDVTPAGFDPTAWNHYAVEFSGSSMSVIINGSLENTFTLTGGLYNGTSKTTTYVAQRYTGANRFAGYIDEFRISTAEYTGCGGFDFGGADMDGSCSVDYGDIAEISKDWLECTDPQGEDCIEVN